MLCRLMVLLSVAAMAVSGFAEDAANRGVNDSVVSTLVGGNIGAGAADAKTVPLGRDGNGLRDIVQDSSGNFYYNDGNRILKQTPAGVLSVYAGATNSGYAGDGGPATQALFDDPRFLTI